MSLRLVFNAHFNRDNGLDYGRLSINDDHRGVTNIWRASTSHASKQYPESFHERGGMLPPTYRVPGLPFYTVSTKPIPMPQTKGVRGNFYQILPFEVVTDKGGKRSDFGIHKDADAPGSLGCIVMSGDRFNQFEAAMQQLRSQGIDQLPLGVYYS